MKKKIIPLKSRKEVFHVLNENDIEKRFGFVAMLDALGTKNSTYDEIQDFINNLKLVSNSLKFNDNFMKAVTIKKVGSVNKQIEITPFQDTIIISLDVQSEDNMINYINYFSTFIQYFVTGFFIGKSFLRGAISYGEYFVIEEKFYFGEAINDVSNWYEKLDMIGVMTTPKFSNYLDYIHQVNKESLLSLDKIHFSKLYDIFTSTKVLSKDKQLVSTWLCNWPLVLSFHSSRPESNINPKLNALGFYYAIIKSVKIPKGTESKYFNTNEYVEVLFEKYKAYLEIERPQIIEMEKVLN